MADEHREQVLLDACVTINLLASGIPLHELAHVLNMRFLVAEPASREALYLPAESGQGSERVDVEALVAADAIEFTELHVPELDHYVSFAVHVDDGEASTLAVAVHRGLRVATDDRKARRLAGAQAPPVELTSTPEMLRACADTVIGHRLPEAVRRIEGRASFRPRRDDPHFAWWTAARAR